jgi:hypothetical protein
MEELICIECHKAFGYSTDSAPKGIMYCLECGEEEIAKDSEDN